MFTKEDLYRLSLKAYRDNQNAMEYMFQKGLEEGQKEGMKQGRFKALIEIATRRKQINLPVEQIVQVINCEEIEKL